MSTSEETQGAQAASQAPAMIDAAREVRQARAQMYAKMAKVMAKMHRLPKRGYNTHFGYQFTTNEDVVDAVRTAMAEVGLAMFTEFGKIQDSTIPGRSGERAKVRVEFIFTIVDGETGYFEERHWVSEALDDQDKALNKAVTAAQKYFLLKTFLIGTGDEPDPDQEGEAEKEEKKGKGKGKASQASQNGGPGQGNGQAPKNGGPAGAPPRGRQVVKYGLAPTKAQAVELPTWPKDAKDNTTYFGTVVKFLNVDTQAAVWYLNTKQGNALAAAKGLADGERPIPLEG